MDPIYIETPYIYIYIPQSVVAVEYSDYISADIYIYALHVTACGYLRICNEKLIFSFVFRV